MNYRTKLGGLAAMFLIASTALTVSCQVNEYCLNCGKAGDGGADDALDSGDDSNTSGDDAGDGGNCIPTGPEVCNGKDDDCNGIVDDGTLPQVGNACQNQMGECAGGILQCTMGALTCSKKPKPEICDTKDNDCNGVPDDGDPGGGAVCGTSTGECVAGTNHCVSGTIQCIGSIGTVGGQVETCNGKDDDCDGNFDEGLGVLGACSTGTNTGECNIGNLMCVGGVPTCVGAIGPSPELCDNLDQDCDGNPTNGFDLTTDPTNCGTCGHLCDLSTMHAFAGCGETVAMPAPHCTIAACFDGYHDNNSNPADGCEFGPCQITGPEVCDGIDNDCNPATNEATLTPPANLCLNAGECLNAHTAACTGGGFKCTYTDPDVQKDATGNITPETLCDGKDNDCDGFIDEGQPNLGQACDNGMIGQCRSSGTFQCDANNRTGPAVCVYTTTGTAPGTEVCDGIDNNCNGQVDEGANTGNLGGQEWVTIPGGSTQIMKYEASRPGASAALPGTDQTFACSKAGVQPWTNIKYPDAVAACASINARLCSEAEWQHMCEPPTTYPAPGPATANVNDFTFIEAEDAFANTTVGGRTWAKQTPLAFNGVTAMQVADTGFSVLAANALANAPRLDYQLNLLAATNYTMFVRMRSPTTGALGTAAMNTPTAPIVGLNPASAAATAVNDLVIVVTWSPTTTNGIPTHTLQTGFTLIGSQTLDDGNNDGRLSVAYKVATTAGAAQYQAFTSNGAADYTGLLVMKNGTYDINNIVVAGSSDTGTGAPNPPNIVGSGNMTVIALGGWNLGASSTTTVGAPANSFTLSWDLAGNVRAELAAAIGSVLPGANRDPGQFTQAGATVNGTAAMTIGIGTSSSNSIWTGLTAGTTAGAANATPLVVPSDGIWQWVQSPTFTTVAAGTYTFSVWPRTDGVYVDTIAVARHTSTPTFDDSWAYQNTPRTAQPQTCNDDDFDTDPIAAGDQDGIVPTGSLLSCFANQAGTNDAYDMSGNVKEWTAARAAGQNPIRGGASDNEVTGTTCNLNFTLANDTFFFPNVGFRCCR